MKKSCGIITFHSVINYGAVLQAYALKKTMSTYCDTFIIRHENPQMMSKFSLVPPFPKDKNTLKQFLIKTLTFYRSFKKKQGFSKFRKKYLYDTKPQGNADFYITGSDQVWNPLCSFFDKAYFLDFTEPGKKNSYSASFGLEEIPEKYRAESRELLNDFNKISVRENKGKKIISELLGKDVPVTLDPIFLLDKDAWNKEMNYPVKEKPYILVYAFTVSDRMAEFVNRLSEEKNLRIIVLSPAKSLLKKSKFKNAKYITSVSPEGWVQYINCAEYVVTNSFHGTAFSINLNKKFFVDLLPESLKVNSRITDLLKLFELQNRYISDNSDFDSGINYQEVNKKLEEEKAKSICYLESIVGDYNEQN